MQGHVDSPLTDHGRAQAALLGGFLAARKFSWDTAYSSPLSRALETAKILAEKTGCPAPTIDPDLRELSAGDLEGLDRDEISERFPQFLEREITDLGDFSAFGGETYDAVQRRVRRLVSRLEQHHRELSDSVLLVAHGGILFQLVKAVVCIPVPRVCILRWGNCTATLLRFRERRGMYMAEIAWHLPIDLVGGESGEGTARLFR